MLGEDDEIGAWAQLIAMLSGSWRKQVLKIKEISPNWFVCVCWGYGGGAVRVGMGGHSWAQQEQEGT